MVVSFVSRIHGMNSKSCNMQCAPGDLIVGNILLKSVRFTETIFMKQYGKTPTKLFCFSIKNLVANGL